MNNTYSETLIEVTSGNIDELEQNKFAESFGSCNK